MTKKVVMIHKDTGYVKNGFIGFSWTTLLFYGLPALLRRDWLGSLLIFGTVLILFLLSPNLLIFGIICPLPAIIGYFFYNKWYTYRLVKAGYVFHENYPQIISNDNFLKKFLLAIMPLVIILTIHYTSLYFVWEYTRTDPLDILLGLYFLYLCPFLIFFI